MYFFVIARGRVTPGHHPFPAHVFGGMDGHSEELDVKLFWVLFASVGELLETCWYGPSSNDARVRCKETTRTVFDGPLVESKAPYVAEWWLNAKSRQRAIEWVKRLPVALRGESEIDILHARHPSDIDPPTKAP